MSESEEKVGLLTATGQKWKIQLFIFCNVIAMLVMLYGLVFQEKNHMFVIFFGFVLFFVTFIWVNFSIKCPECGCKWHWWAISKKDSKLHRKWLAIGSKCPACTKDFNSDL